MVFIYIQSDVFVDPGKIAKRWSSFSQHDGYQVENSFKKYTSHFTKVAREIRVRIKLHSYVTRHTRRYLPAALFKLFMTSFKI